LVAAGAVGEEPRLRCLDAVLHRAAGTSEGVAEGNPLDARCSSSACSNRTASSVRVCHVSAFQQSPSPMELTQQQRPTVAGDVAAAELGVDLTAHQARNRAASRYHRPSARPRKISSS